MIFSLYVEVYKLIIKPVQKFWTKKQIKLQHTHCITDWLPIWLCNKLKMYLHQQNATRIIEEHTVFLNGQKEKEK